MFNFGITFQSESSNSPVNRKAEKLEGEIGCLSSCRQQRKSPPTVKIAANGEKIASNGKNIAAKARTAQIQAAER
jgi:hypothetical protein